MKTKDQEFLEMVVSNLVSHPEDIHVVRKTDEMGVLFLLTVNPEDMKHIVGKQGVNANAIRTLLRVVGMKNQARISLKIVEPERD